MKFHMLFGSDNTPIFGELTIAHNEAFFASEDGAIVRKMQKPEISNMTPDGITIKGFVAVGIKKGVDQFEIHEWRCNLNFSEKTTTKLATQKIEAAILINVDEAKKSYANFMKIDENILMLLNEDDNAFYFLHRKKDFWWKISVSKKVKELFSPLYSITEKEIESYNKWLNGSK